MFYLNSEYRHVQLLDAYVLRYVSDDGKKKCPNGRELRDVDQNCFRFCTHH